MSLCELGKGRVKHFYGSMRAEGAKIKVLLLLLRTRKTRDFQKTAFIFPYHRRKEFFEPQNVSIDDSELYKNRQKMGFDELKL